MLRSAVASRVVVAAPLARQALALGAPVVLNHTRRLLHSIDVAGWIQQNSKPYGGGSEFLAPATERTKEMWAKCRTLLDEEIKKGVLDVDPTTPSSILSHGPGYIDEKNELIKGLQTDAPLKRAIKPFGGINMVKQACEAYGYNLDPAVVEIFSKYRKTHNAGVFDVYSEGMRKARSNHIITGLPDAYGRGRIIGDNRRIALYGVEQLIKWKQEDKKELDAQPKLDATIRQCEELAEQIRALEELKELGKRYGGCNLARPAQTAQEAVQWLYFGYLAAVKQQDGAAMSIGRIDSFLDTYIEKDIAEGKLTESQAQELVDDFIIKLRLVRHLRTPEYNDLFAGDPTWVTLTLAGSDPTGRAMVSKTSYRFLNTLYNLGPAPEPNLTVLWANNMPQSFKDFCAKVSVDTSSIQYESDKQMSKYYGHDCAVACCVSGMAMGKQMQFFGARCNMAKLLLYSMNGGRDEVTTKQVGPKFPVPAEGPLQYDQVVKNYDAAMDWMAGLYVNTMNIIHYMHDKYCYESVQMALHDTDVKRWMAFGVAGLSVVADSLSAIKYAEVTPVRDPKTGLTTDFIIKGDFPKYGNDDQRVDAIASDILNKFSAKLKSYPTYRDAEHTLSALTITSNVVYGRATGPTPDGRKRGEAFAPGANPMHGRDSSGALCSLNSVAQLPYEACLDGISNTFSIVPATLGKTEFDRTRNLGALLDGYFEKGAHHLNVNVLNRETLEDAMAHPEKYPQLTIRVSGYAVNFVRLTPAQQMEVIARTFHESM